MLSVRPRIYQIKARVSAGGENIYNYLEDVSYYPNEGDIVLSGTMEEEWLIGVDKFLRKYCLPDGRDIDLNEFSDGEWHVVQTKESDYICNCYLVPIEEGSGTITTAQGHVLTYNREGISHGNGDYVFVDGDDQWVVNGCVFENTYDIL